MRNNLPLQINITATSLSITSHLQQCSWVGWQILKPATSLVPLQVGKLCPESLLLEVKALLSISISLSSEWPSRVLHMTSIHWQMLLRCTKHLVLLQKQRKQPLAFEITFELALGWVAFCWRAFLLFLYVLSWQSKLKHYTFQEDFTSSLLQSIGAILGNSYFHHWNSCHLEFIDVSLGKKMKVWAYLAWISNEPSFFPATSGRLQGGLAEQGREEDQFLDQQVQSSIVKLPGLQLYRDLQSYQLLRKTLTI